jgi:hypothetical protein
VIESVTTEFAGKARWLTQFNQIESECFFLLPILH